MRHSRRLPPRGITPLSPTLLVPPPPLPLEHLPERSERLPRMQQGHDEVIGGVKGTRGRRGGKGNGFVGLAAPPALIPPPGSRRWSEST